MPRLLVRARNHDRRRSVGWLAVAWMEALVLHGPGDVQGEPIRHGDEYTGFIVDCYAVDESTRRLYDGAFLSRPKGCDKSGLAARLALFEAFGPCRGSGEFAQGGEVYRDPFGLGFVYEYEPGEPIARHVKVPYVRCMATEEGQTGNVYDSIHFNLTDEDAPLSQALARADDAGRSRILLPGGGEITPSTASSAAKDGGKETFVPYDETHLYVRPELHSMYATVNRNLRKRKKIAETWYLETTTMFGTGEESVAEQTYKVAELIASGKAKRERLLLDHRWGAIDPDELGDELKLRAALTDAYGDALDWNDLDGMVDQAYDPKAKIADTIRYFLNDKFAPQGAWLSEGEIRSAAESGRDRVLVDGDQVALGFDGSRGRAKGKPDATALVGCRLSDGHVFEIGVWEADEIPSSWDSWEPPLTVIEAAVAAAFDRFDVAAFYADPAKDWRSYVNGWEAKYGGRVTAKARRDHPFEWWMTGGRASAVQQAIEDFEGALRNGDATLSGEFRLIQHLTNARRRLSHGKLALGKENDYSPHKIDAAVAAVLAWQARLDAIAAGATQPQKKPTGHTLKRLR